MSKMRIEEIAYTIGFKDKSWFMHKFKEIYHMTPNQYRKLSKTKEKEER